MFENVKQFQLLAISAFMMISCTELPIEDVSSNTTVSDDSDEGMNFIISLLEEEMPTWNGAINEVPDTVAEMPFQLPPNEMAAEVSNEEFIFFEERNNGRSVYKNSTGNSVFKYDDSIGYWKFISPSKNNATFPEGMIELDDDGALLLANRLFDSFGLPYKERGGFVSVGVGDANATPRGPVGRPKAVARHVRIFRRINWIPVFDSHLMVTYNFDGTPFRVEVRWPRFVIDETKPLIGRKTVIKDLASWFIRMYPGNESIGKAISRIDPAIVYYFIEEEGVFEPTIMLSIFNRDKTTSFVGYSLVNGLWEEETPGDCGDV